MYTYLNASPKGSRLTWGFWALDRVPTSATVRIVVARIAPTGEGSCKMCQFEGASMSQKCDFVAWATLLRGSSSTDLSWRRRRSTWQTFLFCVAGAILLMGGLFICVFVFSAAGFFLGGSWFYTFLLLSFSASLLFCCSASLLFYFFASLLFCFLLFLLLCLSACLLLCFTCLSFLFLCFPFLSAFLLLCFFFSASLLSLLLCFSAFVLCLLLFLLLCFSCFSASLLYLLLFFSASLLSLLLCFSAFVLLCLSTSTILLFLFFSHVFLLLYFLLLCFSASCLYCLLTLFFFSFALFSPVCILKETLKTLGETQRNPKEILIRTPDKKPYMKP